MTHFFLGAIYSACIGAFFAGMLREDWRSAMRLFGTIFGVMVGGMLVLGWVMYLLG